MNQPLPPLPDDPAELRRLVLSLYESWTTEREAWSSERKAWSSERGLLKQQIGLLQEQLNLLKAHRFGRSREKFADHPSLFDEAELEALTDSGDDEDEAVEVSGHQRRKKGRKVLPETLPREEIIHDLAAEEKVCAIDGHALVEIGREFSEQLDIIPARVKVIRHVRIKYSCPHCHMGVKLAPMPPQPIPKALATASMLAWVATSKYADALPLYRQSNMLVRAGIELPRATLANWMIRCGRLVQPLINLMRDQMLAHGVIQMDETPVQVLKEDGKAATSRSYMWVQRGGPPDGRVILFNYDSTRSGQVPIDLLEGYYGWLQTDGYKGYLAVASMQGIQHLGCWAHARRMLVDAHKANKKSAKVAHGLKLIGELYVIEKRIRELTPAERYKIRQQEVPPVLARIREWLAAWSTAALPSSALGKALAYLVEQWPRLIRYIEDGRLEIDNNGAENAIRPFVVGRKNWLFSNSVPGVKASANLYGLIETAKANGLEPFAYLRHMFERIPLATTVDDFDALLPWRLNPDMSPKVKPAT